MANGSVQPVKLTGTKEEEFNWAANASNGQVTVTQTFVGDVASAKTLFANHARAYGELVSAPSGSPFGGLLYVGGATYELLGVDLAKVSLSWNTPTTGAVEDTGSFQDQHYETADYTVMERNIRYAPFWVNDFGATEQFGDIEEARAWKAVQTYIDAEISTEEEQAELESKVQTLAGTHWSVVQKMISMRLGGVDSFYVPVQTISMSDITNTAQVDVGENVGLVSMTKPKGFRKLNLSDDLEWLNTGDTITFDGTSYHREQRWSGANIWDKSLYQRINKA